MPTSRNPWLFALVSLIFGPVIGMCRLGRGRLALGYFVVALALLAGLAFLMQSRILHPVSPGLFWLIVLLYRLIGAAHGFRLVRRGAYGREWYARWYVLAGALAALCLGAVAFRSYLYQPVSIPATSMWPGIMEGDYLIVSKSAYAGAAPARGDVIAFRSRGRLYIKRVIGLPGDTAQMQAGRLYLNGKKVPRVASPDFIFEGWKGTEHYPRFTETLPGGARVAMLDTRLDAPYDDTAEVTVPEAQYFVLGDHRDNSLDSRAPEIGFVPAADITGRAAVILWNARTQKFAWREVK